MHPLPFCYSGTVRRVARTTTGCWPKQILSPIPESVPR